MVNEELTPHIQELQRVLGDKIDEQQLEMELNKYLNEYHVNIDAAKRGIIRKYGGADDSTVVTGNTLVKKIEALNEWEQIIADAQAEAEAIRDAIKAEMMERDTEDHSAIHGDHRNDERLL